MPEYQDINDEILNLWRNFPNERGNRIPLLFPPSADDCVLFISLNPSFPNQLINRNWNHPYDIAMLDNINVDQVIQQEIHTQNHLLPYFTPLQNIAGELNLPWSHLDIFMLRETLQNEAMPRVWNTNANQFAPFGIGQFNLFTRALQRSTPRIIVVINALASRIIKAQLPLFYNQEDGCYYAQDEEIIGAPFFLGSALSGQGQVDRFSRERLIWHIQHRLGNMH